MRAFIFEGQPKEIAEAMKEMGMSPSSVSTTSNVTVPTAEKDGEEAEEAEKGAERTFIASPVVRKVITRRALAAQQKKMLTEIYNAGEKGILGTKLAEKLDYSQAQFRGLMGAWGRRITNTPGYDGQSIFFDYEWDHDEGSYRYWLPDSVREAVRIEVIDKK